MGDLPEFGVGDLLRASALNDLAAAVRDLERRLLPAARRKIGGPRRFNFPHAGSGCPAMQVVEEGSSLEPAYLWQPCELLWECGSQVQLVSSAPVTIPTLEGALALRRDTRLLQTGGPYVFELAAGVTVWQALAADDVVSWTGDDCACVVEAQGEVVLWRAERLAERPLLIWRDVLDVEVCGCACILPSASCNQVLAFAGKHEFLGRLDRFGGLHFGAASYG